MRGPTLQESQSRVACDPIGGINNVQHGTIRYVEDLSTCFTVPHLSPTANNDFLKVRQNA